MFFHSLSSLLIFLPTFFIIYSFLKKYSLNFSKIFLLIFSLVFYGFDVPWFVIPLIISASSDFYISKYLIDKKNKFSDYRKIILVISFCINLSLLVIFKYHYLISSTFFRDNQLLFLNNSNNIMPVGISFYTFQTLSFTIDSFRGKIKKIPRFIDYLLYVCYFPQLVAGPILRFSNFFDNNSSLLLYKNLPKINYGFYRICYGLFIKLCLADELSRLNDIAFNSDYSLLGFVDCWTMTFGFGLQIYFDFSAYSHLAIGISNIIGINIPENFNFPYNSKSATEFWKRWHISLSSWVSDYLYRFINNNLTQSFFGAIPLFVTWIIMGLWHGASWRFAMWGLMNGILILVHRLYKSIVSKSNNKIIESIYSFITLSSIMSTWIYFRSSSWDQANNLFIKLFKFDGLYFSFRENYYLFVFLFLITSLLLGELNEYIKLKKTSHIKIVNIIFSSFALAFSIIFINRQASFIYFQF